VLFRLLQGFALGGEVGPNIAYLLEAARPNRRGLFISLNFATADLAVLAAGIVGLALSSALTASQLDQWGWRVAFLLGAAIVPLGLRLRRTLVETLPPEPVEAEPLSLRPFLVIAGAGLLVIGAGTISNYTLEYLTTYAQTTLHMVVRDAFGATVVIGIISVACDLAGGLLADRFGPKRVLLVPWLLLSLLAVPAFLVLSQFPTRTTLLSVSAALTFMHILGSSPAVLLFVQALPARIRAGATGFVYAVAVAFFGGTTQLFEALLIRWTGNPAMPGWYMAGAVLAGLIGAMLIPERERGTQAPDVRNRCQTEQ
jgi:predicted MFS family arabinose efflux permease